MQRDDWGECTPRWAGIRSETTTVQGWDVHVLRAEPADRGSGGWTHLLVHPMAGSGSYWLEVMRPLAAYGAVLAPDLPGTLTGHTELPRRGAARPETIARFLRALTTTLCLDQVVVHGWSSGGLAALLFADLAPARNQRLVLVDPTLPGPQTALERFLWHTLGRLALVVGPALARAAIPLLGARLLDLKLRRLTPQALTGGRLDVTGGDLPRIPPELAALLAEELAGIRTGPRRLSGAVTAFAATVSAMFVDRRRAQEAMDRVAAPTLLLWGDRDPLIDRRLIDQLTTGHPGWDLHAFQAVGHLPPMVVPDAYVEVVGRWLGRIGADAG